MNPSLVVSFKNGECVIKRQGTNSLKPQKITAFNTNSARGHYYEMQSSLLVSILLRPRIHPFPTQVG